MVVGTDVVRLDLKTGKTLRGLQAHPDAGLPFQHPAMTPDGKYLFLSHVSAGASKVLRIRIEADKLTVEDSRPTAVKAQHAFCISPDSKVVAWYSPYVADKKQETAFYPVAKWDAPAFTVPERARAMGFASDGTLYVHTHDTVKVTVRYVKPGEKDATQAFLPWQGPRIREFMFCPQRAGSFLVSAGGQTFVGERMTK